jgi:hypothetical protein
MQPTPDILTKLLDTMTPDERAEHEQQIIDLVAKPFYIDKRALTGALDRLAAHDKRGRDLDQQLEAAHSRANHTETRAEYQAACKQVTQLHADIERHNSKAVK